MSKLVANGMFNVTAAAEKGAKPQFVYWDECPSSFKFCAGKDGEEVYHIVYNTRNTASSKYSKIPYLCIVSHTKNSTYPSDDVANSVNPKWMNFQTMALFATDLMLARKILAEEIDVDSLTVRNVSAVSSDGNTTCTIDGKTGKLTAKNAEFDGVNAVNADVSGKIIASSGQIAGLKIAGNALTNEGFDNDAYIVIRNDSQDRFMGVGANVDPATSSAITLGRYENHTVTGANDLVTNIAIKASAKGGNNGNYALYIRYGNVTGVRHVLRAVSTSTTLNVMDHTVICKHTEGEITITLPSTAENGQEFWMMSANNKNVKVVVGNSAHKITSSGASFASARWHIYIFCSADNTWCYGYTNN